MKLEQLNRLRDSVGEVLIPPPAEALSVWAEKHFRLSREYSNRSGPLRLYGWQKAIFDAFTDRSVREVVVMSGTQLCKSLLLQVALAYVIAVEPGPVLLVQPKDSAAKRFSKKRLGPMIRDCAVLHGKVSGKRRDSSNTIEYKAFPGGDVTLVGAISPDNLARETIQYLMLDEVDKYEASAGGEGDPVNLAVERTVTYGARAKVVVTCSPTIKGHSRIGAAYDASDGRKPWVPCPQCGQFQVLDFWTGVKWDNSLPREQRAASAYYECSGCSAHWSDVDRWAACERAEWRAERPFRGVAGFWISHVYSPWKTLAQIVDAFLDAKGNPMQFQAFINTTLAEPWVERGEAPASDSIYGKREFYEQGVAPQGCLMLTGFVDVQGDRLEVEVKGWGRDGQCWSVGADVLPGDTSQKAVWDSLHEVVVHEFPHANGGALPIWAIGIDSGYRPQAVYQFAARYAQPAYGPAGAALVAVRTVVPTKGGHAWDRPIEGFSPVDAAKKRGGLRILTLGASYLKQAVYDALRLPIPAEGSEFPSGYWHYPDYEYSWFQGLTSESRIVRDNGRSEWVKDGSVRNEPLDLAAGNLAMFHLCRTRLDRFKEADWAGLERLTLGPKQDEPQPAPPPRERKPNWVMQPGSARDFLDQGDLG
jgi:phage terminase large subunit GpA-like protein